MFSRFQIALALSLFALWLMATPYYGVRHDAVLYSLQALLKLEPEAFSRDIFFRFGSQEKYTVFPILHAWAIQVAGLDAAALLLTVLGKGLWFGGLLWFASSFLRGKGQWLGLALVVGVSPFYDQWQVFSYGESFATARLYAEAAVLFGLGCVLRQYWRSGAAALLLSASLHPLIALPGVCAAILFVWWKSPRVFVGCLVGLVGVILLLALAGVAPLDKLLQAFDSAWWGVVERRNPYIFLDFSDPHFGGRVAFIVVALLSVRKTPLSLSHGIANVMLVLGIGMLLVSFIGATQLQNVLITQLQLWRALWLVQLATLLLLGGVLIELWQGDEPRKLLAVILASAALLNGLSAALLAIFGLGGVFLVLRYWPQWRPSRTIWAVAFLILILSAVEHVMEAALGRVWAESLEDFKWMVDSANAVSASLAALALWGLATRCRSREMFVTVFLAGVFWLGAVLVWHEGAVTVWAREGHATDASSADVQKNIPESATVYWPGRLNDTWFWLRRNAYVSQLQAAGVVFSRDTAMEVLRRQNHLYSMGLDDGNPYWWAIRQFHPRVDVSSRRRDWREAATTLCQDDQLDYLIVPAGTSIAYVMVFKDPVGAMKWALIDCATLRSVPQVNP